VLLFVAALSGMPAHARPRHGEAWAREHFAAAERMREALNGRPPAERTRHDYQRVINAYRHVYYGAPISTKADASVFVSAGLLVEMGRQFNDEKILKSAVDEYEFLRREYPGSKYRFDALFSIAEIYKEDLGDPVAAEETFQKYLKEYPNGHMAEEARAALKECEEAAKSVPHTDVPRITGIKRWATPDYTRVVINLNTQTRFYALRINRPERILFDLPNTRLPQALIGKTMAVDDGLVRKIRIAENKPGNARVVLDVDDMAEYTASLNTNPPQLIIDVRSRPLPLERMAKASNTKSAGVKSAAVKPEPPADDDDSPALQEGGTEIADVRRIRKSPRSQPSTSSDPNIDGNDSSVKSAGNTKVKKVIVAEDDADTSDTGKKVSRKPSVKAVAVSSRSGRKLAAKDTSMREAKPTSDGDRSLIRALGLKIGRIVIDPGHGGHDTGTIGPSGLMEKDLVLDVAKRLGNLLSTRLGADVVYTRDDDTFIPLENRTAIANEEQADLFVSVHANSSDDPAARGVETYYLNFTSSADALEVAARENAASEKSVHELQDLVKKIALKEKVEESREFASDVQKALYTGLSARSPEFRDRGVKKAPFVVLIGANMPSILAEISFVSNPTDERKLETGAYRQKIAESLYRGISRYANGLSGVKVAARLPKAAGQ
jgi:N-acetylmuramoyl-L-alanine amidase